MLEVFENRVLTDLCLGDGRPRPRWKTDIKLVLRKNRMGGLEVDSLSPEQSLVLGSSGHGDGSRDSMTTQGICRLA